MGIYEGILSKSLADSNLQKSMMHAGLSDYALDDLDFSLARYFYNYLIGLDDRLPVYSYVDRVIDRIIGQKESGNKAISCGMGMIITCKYGEDGRYLRIYQEDPLTKDTTRREIIDADTHSICKVNPHSSFPMDSDEVPVFREERVLSMQEYLLAYSSRKSMSNKVR